MKHIHQACKPSCYSLRTRSYSRPTEYEEYDMPTPKTARLHARVATLYTLLCAGWSNTEYQGSTDPPGVALILQEYEKSADGGTALHADDTLEKGTQRRPLETTTAEGHGPQGSTDALLHYSTVPYGVR